MDAEIPPELLSLLDRGEPAVREKAWTAFLESHNQLLLKAAESFGQDYDARMDRYRFILENLRKDDFKRLRSYRVRGRSSFRSWLAVVARRLCLDYERSRYGRGGRAANRELSERERTARRRLTDLTGVGIDVDVLPQRTTTDPEDSMREAELREKLDSVLGTLDPRDRLLLKLRFEDGLTMRQVADVMRFPTVFHAYRHFKPLLEDVRRRLLEAGVGESVP